MAAQSPYQGVDHVIQVQSSHMVKCSECGEWPAKTGSGSELLASSVNHYFGHGYKLLHMGSETFHDYAEADQPPQLITIAVLGK